MRIAAAPPAQYHCYRLQAIARKQVCHERSVIRLRQPQLNSHRMCSFPELSFQPAIHLKKMGADIVEAHAPRIL